MHQHLLEDIGLCIVSATVLAYVARMLHQPLLLAYIGAGILIGPVGLKWITEREVIQQLSEIGLAFLLFIVGLEIDVKKLASSGRVALLTTLIQMGGSGAMGWAAAVALGYRGLPAVYVGAAIAFSSTMIVVKLLSDRSELDTLPGRITLGVLVLQDVAAIVALAVQPNLGGGAGGSPLATMGLSVAKGLGLVAGTLAVSRFVLPHLFRLVARSPEVLLASAISWCSVVCYAAMRAGFSIAMGALIAGVSISTFPYTLEVVAKIRPLRDFFVTLFFVSLGMLLKVPTLPLVFGTAMLTAAVLLSRVATVLPALRLLGYDNRVGLLSSLHLAQVSEFALVIVILGVGFRHIDEDVVTLVLMTLVVTCTLSTYLIQFSHRIVAALVRRARETILEDRQSMETRLMHHEAAPLVLVGCFRIASSLVHDLIEAGKKFSVIDFNPEVHSRLKRLGVPCYYGDISHTDVLEHAGVAQAEILVASITDDFLRGTTNRKLLEVLRRLNPRAKIIVTADSPQRALELYEAGADYVLVPRVLSANHLLQIIESAEVGDLPGLREFEISQLKARREVVP